MGGYRYTSKFVAHPTVAWRMCGGKEDDTTALGLARIMCAVPEIITITDCTVCARNICFDSSIVFLALNMGPIEELHPELSTESAR